MTGSTDTFEVATLEVRSLGNATHVIASPDGEAVVVDPPRDAWHVAALAAERGWRLTHVLETHVHNDYLSGALELRASHGVEILAPARGGYEFAHRPMADGDAIEVGGLRFRARATPGHTPEHLAWDVRATDARDDAPPFAVATGGSLLSGTAGRTDLLGPDRTDALTRAQFSSLRALATLPADVTLLPTHGAGSFCGAGAADRSRVTTIGRERADNPWLRTLDEETFVRSMVEGFGPYPAYYREMAPRNRQGPAVLGGPPSVGPLTVDELRAAMARGVPVIDARPRASFAAGHVPGSLNIELGDGFASYVGWHLPIDGPLALVLPEPVAAAASEAADQLLRIGVDRIVGILAGGVEAWATAGGDLAAYPTIAARDLAAIDPAARGLILDVRDAAEIGEEPERPGVKRIPHDEVAAHLADLPADAIVTVACKSGARASIAASVLDAHHRPVRLVVGGGMLDLPSE